MVSAVDPYDMIVRNGLVVRPDGILKSDIAVRAGRIAALGAPIDAICREDIDAEGKFVLPGLIDTHVHLGTMEQRFSECVGTESAAAAAGGITTALVYREIPVLIGHGLSLEAFFRNDIDAIAENSLIDMGFHGLILEEKALDRIDELSEALGITSFKFVMAYKGEEAMPHFYGMDDGSLFRSMERVGKKSGCLCVVHAENSEINQRFRRENCHRQDLSAWSDSRPAVSEEESIRKGMFLAVRAEAPICIAHVSTGRGGHEVERAKREGSRVFQETCPHYLFFTKELKVAPPSLGKVNPPLRDETDVAWLWKLMGKGGIDVIGSDHCPFTRKFKSEDLWNSRPGLPGLSFLLPVLLSEGVNKGRIAMEDVSQLTARGPAKLFGLFPRKGVIEIGSDADLVIVDLDKEVQVGPAMLRGVSDYTPYEGFTMKGWPVMTIARGRVIFRGGEVSDRPGGGLYLKRTGISGSRAA
jgi:dihydropyrimidinase